MVLHNFNQLIVKKLVERVKFKCRMVFMKKEKSQCPLPILSEKLVILLPFLIYSITHR